MRRDLLTLAVHLGRASVLALSAMLVAGCGGTSSSPAPTTPTAPPAAATAMPTITVRGSAEAHDGVPFAFPTSVTLGGPPVAALRPSALERLWSRLVPSLLAQSTVAFSIAIDFPLTPSSQSQYITWDFGDGSIYRYGCKQTDPTKLCDNLQRGLSPSHTFRFSSCTASFAVVVTAETTAGTVTKTIPVTFSNEPLVTLTVDSSASVGAGPGSVQVNWTLSACNSTMTLVSDSSWMRPAGCAYGSSGLYDIPNGCAGTSGKGTYGRTFTVDRNDTTSARTGHINLGVQGGNSATITVQQAAGAGPGSGSGPGSVPDCAAGRASLTSDSPIFIGAGGGSANVSWTLPSAPTPCQYAMTLTSDSPWLPPRDASMGYLQVIANGYQGVGSPGVYGRNFSAGANTTGSVRTATLTLSIAGANTITVPVQQAAR